MGESKARAMRANDWTPVPIERGKYFNKAHAITGHARSDGQGGNPLHPACIVEDRLQETFARLRQAYRGVSVARYHVKMPYWHPDDCVVPDSYAWVETPQRLATTSVTVVTVAREQIKTADMGFYFDGGTLPSLRERLRGVRFQGVSGNLGYFMTAGLINDKFPWSHNRRYPGFPLPTTLSYLGFHLFRDVDGGAVYGSFQGAHPAAVAIRNNGEVEIIPRLEVTRYKVTLWGQELIVDSIDEPAALDRVMLFTPGLRTPEVRAHADSWQTYAPMIPVADRVNVFIASEGNGKVPVEKVVKVWDGPAPLPSFGAVLSFERDYFRERFVKVEAFSAWGRRVRIQPLEGTDLTDYAQIMGGFVPVVAAGQHLYCVETVDQVRQRLSVYGNATSPIAECSRESRNFDCRIREPAGILAQTKERIGWVLFDGRHELSIGASVVDVAKMLKMLQDEGAFGGELEEAIMIDGGSAMKAYDVHSDGTGVALDLLNRVAAGSRNGPGADPDGLNLYTLLNLGLAG